VTTGGWGAGTQTVPADLHQWQSPLWAAQFGIAGWLLWPHLGQATRYAVVAMVVDEADRLLRISPDYYARPDGQVLFPGDTKAEEDAWVGGIFTLAAAMLPDHPHARLWRRQEAAFEIASYSTAADDNSSTVVNGRPLRTWLAGWNVFANGTLVNHGINPHPDYMAAIAWNLSAVGVDAIADRPVLGSALHNADLVYRGLMSVTFPSPPFRYPGGTIYQHRRGVIYYPRRDDWGTSLVADFVTLDAGIAALDLAPAANGYLRQHTSILLAMQARSADGRTYQAWNEYGYPGREQWVGEELSRAWLLEWAAGTHRITVTNAALG
jgi:hypothetical protein